MQTENESVARLEPHTESIGLLAEIITEEIAAAAGQAERERDLILAKKLAEHELRVVTLEQMVRERLMDVRDGEKGAPGEKGEKGEKGESGETIKGEAGPQGERGEPGQSITGPQGEPGAPGQAGKDGVDGIGKDGPAGHAGHDGIDGRSFTIRDTYEPGETYAQCDVVTLNSTWFVARKDGPGPCPGPDWKAGPTGRRGERGERGERGPPGAVRDVVSWELDRKRYAAVPILSDGSKGPPLNLRPLFEQFQAEAG